MYEKKNVSEENREHVRRVRDDILDISYYGVLLFLIIIAISLSFQAIFIPNEIPNIFGYKLFMILDEKMEDSLEYGDLVFMRNINTDELKVGDIVAFRNAINTVTIHEIEKIYETDEKTKVFSMVAKSNETNDTKNVKEEKIEGILTSRIPKIGLWIMIWQEPIVTVVVVIIILVIGGIAYFIASKLDDRDERRQHNNLKEKINN